MSTQSNLRAAGREICTRQVETYIRLLHEVFDGRGINVHTNTDVIELHQKRAFQHNIDGTRSRGDEWSLRAFASMPCTAIFLRARAEIKKFALRAASSLDRLNFASKSSKGKILRAVKNFHGPFITPFIVPRAKIVFFFAALPLVSSAVGRHGRFPSHARQ